MATRELTGAPERAEHMVTEPLSPAAAAAVRRLELALSLPVAPNVVRAVTQYEAAAVHAQELAALAASGRMSDLDADSLAAAEDLMAASRVALAAAGQLHLIEAAS